MADINGSQFGEFVYGSNENDTLRGYPLTGPYSGYNDYDGNDTLYGYGGNDSLYGGNQNDTLYGGDGNDTLYGGLNPTYSGNDYLYGGSGSDLLYGGSYNDALYGETENDTLYGEDGNDYLDGGAGADLLIGGMGDDTYVTDSFGDAVTESLNGGTDTVLASISTTLGDNLENLTLGDFAINGIGNSLDNTLTGNKSTNYLSGSYGNDVINSAGNDDTLVGGFGNDSLTGGWGKDKFVFNFSNEGSDAITDFSVADDVIQVSKAGFSNKFRADSVIRSSQFHIGAAAHDRTDRFIYNQSTGSLYFDADGNRGKFAQVQIAQLSSGLGLSRQDIYVTA